MANETGKGGFVKGRSGNPGGRPKALEDVQSLARGYTRTAIEALVSVTKKGPPAARVAAASAILDRAWGKPPQKLMGDPHSPLFSIEQAVATLKLAEVTSGAGNGNGGGNGHGH